MDRPGRRADHRRRAARGSTRVGATRGHGASHGAGSFRAVAGRPPRRDRRAADQGNRQVRRRRGTRGADADHDPVVLHQDDGKGAGARASAGGVAIYGHQEGHRSLPAAARGGNHRAVELPGGQRADGRHRGLGGGLCGTAETVRAHPADRGGIATWLAGVGCARRAGAGAGCPRGLRSRHRQRRFRAVHRIQRHWPQSDGARRPAG